MNVIAYNVKLLVGSINVEIGGDGAGVGHWNTWAFLPNMLHTLQQGDSAANGNADNRYARVSSN